MARTRMISSLLRAVGRHHRGGDQQAMSSGAAQLWSAHARCSCSSSAGSGVLGALLLRGLHSSSRALQSTTASVEHAASAAAEAAGAGATAGWLYKTVKQKGNVSTAEYLEQKRKSFLARLSFWEKFYYAAGLLGAATLVATRVDWDGSKARAAEAQRQRAAALEVKRLEALPAFLAGRSFAPLDEEAEASPDLLVFEGASPAEIQRLADKWRQEKRAAAGGGGAGAALAGGAGQAAGLASRWGLPMSVVASDDDDPFEGMTPEEIDAYMAQHGGGGGGAK